MAGLWMTGSVLLVQEREMNRYSWSRSQALQVGTNPLLSLDLVTVQTISLLFLLTILTSTSLAPYAACS